MIRYVEEAKKRMSTFPICTIVQIPWGENEKADYLTRAGSSALPGQNRNVNLIYAKRKGQNEEVATIFTTEPQEDWRTEIINCLKGRVLASKRDQAQVEAKAKYFYLREVVLYKYAFSNTVLRCLSHNEAGYVLKEVHAGCCGDHAGGRSLARRLLLAGYFWPNMKRIQHCLSKNAIIVRDMDL